jgi:integrase
MASKTLTQLAVERFKPPSAGREIHWDGLLPGFGLRISASGHRSWIAMFRVAGESKPTMQTLGTFAQIPKVDNARQRAREAILAARSGINPVEVRRAEETTVGTVIDRYLEYVDRNLSTTWAHETRRILERDVRVRWGKRPAREIARQDVNDLIDAKAARRARPRKGRTDGAGVQSNRVLSVLSAMFGWAAAQDLVEANPTAGVRRRVKEEPRDRVLDDAEIIRFWAACDGLGLPFGPLFKLLLLTAQRRDEVGGMKWSELDLEKREWHIPAARSKNGKASTVHLSDLAVEIVERLPQIGDSDFVFTVTEKTPASGYSYAKTRIDALMGPMPEWTLHDLRRTATTGMARLGIAPHVVDKILNHTAGTIKGVARIYNRFQYEGERAAALETWGRFVESLVRPTPSNVVQLVR